MPTAARLVAAILFGALAYYVSELVRPIFADERPLPNLALINTGFGILLGWTTAGSRVGGGLRGAIGAGLTTSIALFFLCLFANSFAEMIRRSLRKQYDTPIEAIIAVFELAIDFGQRVLTPEIIGTSLLGGIAAAIVMNITGRFFR